MLELAETPGIEKLTSDEKIIAELLLASKMRGYVNDIITHELKMLTGDERLREYADRLTATYDSLRIRMRDHFRVLATKFGISEERYNEIDELVYRIDIAFDRGNE